MIKARVIRFDTLSKISSVHFVFCCPPQQTFSVLSLCFAAMISHNDEVTRVKQEDVLTALQGSTIFIVNFKCNPQIKAFSSDWKGQV